MCLFGYAPITNMFAWICTTFVHLIIGCAIRYPLTGNLWYISENYSVFFKFFFFFAPIKKIRKTTFSWIDSLKCGTLIRHTVAYPSLKFGDVQAEFKGLMNDHIAKNPSKSFVIPTA